MQEASINCKTCGTNFSGKYCNNCGEKVYTTHDKSVAHFFEEVFHFISHFDGKFFTTIKTIFSRPGQLSSDYCEGIRKPYFKPLSLFLVLIIIYLLFPVFEGLNMHLKYYFTNRIFGNFALEQAKNLMEQKHLTQDQLAGIFHSKSEKVSKFLLLVIIPLTALFYWLMTFRKRKYFYDQIIFSTEVNIMFLLWGFMILPLLLTIFESIYHFFYGHYLPMGDRELGIVMYTVLCLYVGVAARRFFMVTKAQAIALGVGIYFIHFIVVSIIYKFLLFVIVINQIH